jgi:hypothetical protein
LVAAVLDACVLVPSALRDVLLRSERYRLYAAVWSDDILTEVRRTLIARRLATEKQSEALLATLEREFPNARIGRARYEAFIDTMTNHPKDRHVLAAAKAFPASVVVTLNLRDFPPTSAAPHGIVIQSPDDFLIELWSASAPLLIDILRQQAAALRRPEHTLAQVLDNLALHAPSFVALVREALLAAD